MDFVRVEGEERVYDREAVLGRDTKSVFPSESKTLGKMAPDAAAAVMGSMQFVTESQLLEMRAEAGGGGEGEVALKPLTQVLAEAKEAKEAAFQEQWKQMKTGKNRALDDDELEFIAGVEGAKAAQEAAWEDEQNRELDAFREAAKRRSEEASAAAVTRKPSGSGLVVGPMPKAAVAERRPPFKRPLLQHLVRVKPVAAPGSDKPQPSSLSGKKHKGNEDTGQLGASGNGDVSSGSDGGGDEGGGLAGLLGDYGSSSDSD